MSLFDKFQKCEQRLAAEVMGDDSSGVKIISDDLAGRLKQRAAMHASKQPGGGAAVDGEQQQQPTDDKEDSGEKRQRQHLGADDDDCSVAAASSSSGDNEEDHEEVEEDVLAGDPVGGFLEFGASGASAAGASTAGGATAALSAANSKKKTAEEVFDEAATELFMAPVGAYTVTRPPEGGVDITNTLHSAMHVTDTRSGASSAARTVAAADGVTYRGQRGVLAPVTVYVPLWAAGRFLPQHAVLRHHDLHVQSPAEAKQQLFARRFSGYSPIDAVALHQEIEDFIEWLRPTEGELLVRRFIEAQVCSIAKSLFPSCEPAVYGSMTTGLLLPSSDIDLTLGGVDSEKHSVEDVLLQLSRQISLQGLCDGVAPQVILKTRVPLVKYRSRLAPVDVDVSVAAFSAASGNPDTKSSGQVNTEYVLEQMRTFPESRPLIILFKYFLQQRDLAEPFRGGVGSFASSLLVLCFLQHHPIYTTACSQRASYGLGRLFVDLLQYYGTLGFNPQRVGVSLRVNAEAPERPGVSAHMSGRGQRGGGNNNNKNVTHYGENGVLPCFWDRDDPQDVPPQRRFPGQMMLEDPTCPDNNAASSVRTFQFIQNAFEGAYQMLTARAPCLHSQLAPAFLYPNADTALYCPPREVFASRDQAQTALNMLQPINPLTAKRPTLLSRILHADVDLVRRRGAAAAAFARLQRDQLTSEGKLFAQVVQRISATKSFTGLVEVKTATRFDLRGKKSPGTGEKIKDPNAGALLPRHPFVCGYSSALHVAAFEAARGADEIAKARAAATAATPQEPQSKRNSGGDKSASGGALLQNQQSSGSSSSNIKPAKPQASPRQQQQKQQPHHQAARRQREEATSESQQQQQQQKKETQLRQVKRNTSASSDDDDDGDFSSWQNKQ